MTLLRFGVFELDPAIPELRRRGRRVHLQEMPLRALEMLLERPDELVSRETFYAHLWPNDSSGVLDDNLNTAIAKLRLALNDSAHHPRYIETVPKRGYRFVAPVTSAGDAPAPSAAVPADPPPAQSARRRFWSRRAIVSVAVSALLAAIVLAALVIGLSSRSGTTGAAAGTRIATLAVLPFINESRDPADEYFSDGLSEELIGRLARSENLRVVSRTSAFAVKEGLDAREIGRILGADALVEGSVRRDGERLRISVHLVDASNGYQLWSQSYDRRIGDVFAVQEDIALSVANTLTGSLLGPAEAQALMVPGTDPVAYDLYLKGRYYWHKRTESGLRAALDFFDEAVQRAPDYAPALVGLADAYAVLGFYDFVAPANAWPRAQELARRTLEIDPENASAQATLGYAALYYDWDIETAEAHFRQAIALRPGYSKAHQWYANLLVAAGRFDEAEREMRRAQQLDPLSLIASAALGWVRYFAGRHDEALAQFRLTLALDEDFELAYLWSGWSLEELGRYDEAIAMLEEAVARSEGSGISIASLARVHALSGNRAEAERLLEALLGSGEYVPSYEIAKAYLALEQTERAAEWLQRAVEQRSHSLVFLNVDPQLARLRDSGVFTRLQAQVER